MGTLAFQGYTLALGGPLRRASFLDTKAQSYPRAQRNDYVNGKKHFLELLLCTTAISKSVTQGISAQQK